MELQGLFKLHYQPSFLPRLSLVTTSLTPLSKTTFFTPKKKFPHLHKPFSPHQSSPSPSCRPPKPLSVSAASASLQTDEDRLPADIEVIETKEPHSRVRLSVIVPPLVSQYCYRLVLDEYAKESKVPGFRPGKKIPESILINYIGKEYVQRSAIATVLKQTIPHAMSSVKGRAFEDSVRILTKFSEMLEAFSPQDFFRYDAVVDVAPEVKWVSEDAYKNLKIVVEIDNEITAQKASEAELRRRHKALSPLRIVTDRGLRIGDVVVLDIFATTISKDDSSGEKIPSAESKGFHLDTEEGDYLLPGFLDSIIGIQRGETKSFPLQFPESWKQENLQGVHAQFTVECKELFYRDLLDLDDSVADKLLPGCSTLSQVKESILQRCQEVEQTARDQATDNAILDQLSKLIEVVDIPQSLFEEQGRQLYGAKLLELQASRKLDEQQLTSLSSEKALNEYLETERDKITNIIKQMVAVGEIFKRENLQYSTEELVKEVENSVAEFKQHNQEYDEERIKLQVQDILEGAKVLEWLREHADIQFVTRWSNYQLVLSGKKISPRGGVEEPVHILAYYGSWGPARYEELDSCLASIRDGRYLRAKDMLLKLNNLKMPLKWEQVAKIAGHGVAPGRLHVARAMVEAGHVENLKQAFSRYLYDGGPAYATGSEPLAEEAVRLICRTGGVAALAHPWALKNPVAVIKGLKAAGLHAMEVYRSDGKLAVFSDFADAYDLVKIGGSDYHGRGGHDESDLGSVKLPVLAVHEFLKLARPIWCDALKDTLLHFAEEDPSNSNLEKLMRFGKIKGLKADTTLSCGEDVIGLCLYCGLTGEERQAVEFEALRLKLAHTFINKGGRQMSIISRQSR